MEYFVEDDSIVRKIWGTSDTILFIFAGASAEFALNKAVDWLYFTGNLPKDPLGRLFSTVRYARWIVFSEKEEAHKAITQLTAIHKGVEKDRGANIPDWAYRDVLFMLIYYSIAAYELLEEKLSEAEKEEVYQVFYKVGRGMNLNELPPDYNSWLPVRDIHMARDLQNSVYTIDLYKQYKKHLGLFRFKLLIEAQKIIVPKKVGELMNFSSWSCLSLLLPLYKISRKIHLDAPLKSLLLPSAYLEQIKELNVYRSTTY